MAEQGNHQNIGFINLPNVQPPPQQNLIIQPVIDASMPTGYQPPTLQQTSQAYSYAPIINAQRPNNPNLAADVSNNRQKLYNQQKLYNPYVASSTHASPPPPPPPYQGPVPNGFPAQGYSPNYSYQALGRGPGGMPYNPNSVMPRIQVLSKCPACGFEGYTNVEFETGSCAFWCGFGLCCLTGILCCWIPYVVDTFKDAKHYCKQCHRQIGVMRQC